MLTLLLIVLICGVCAWIIYSIPMPDPFKKIAIGILIIFIVIVFFQMVLGVNVRLPLR